jgi:hypothetical protein
MSFPSSATYESRALELARVMTGIDQYAGDQGICKNTYALAKDDTLPMTLDLDSIKSTWDKYARLPRIRMFTID